MVLKARDIPDVLVERIGAAYPASAVFDAEDISAWPATIFQNLQRQGFLQSYRRARSLICPGCEWSCHKPVVVRSKTTTLPKRAFIVCDEAPDFGRIALELDDLRQFQTSITKLADVVGMAAGVKTRNSRTPASTVHVGTIKGRYGPRTVALRIDAGCVVLSIGDHSVALTDHLKIVDLRLQIDPKIVGRLANRKQANHQFSSSHVPDRTQQKKRKIDTAKEDGRIFRRAQQLRKSHGASWTEVAVQISKTPFAVRSSGKRLSADRIRKIIYEQRI